MPKITISMPTDLHQKIVKYSEIQDDSLSHSICYLAELGLMVKENQKEKEENGDISLVEEHCFNLIMQTASLVKKLSVEKFNIERDYIDNLQNAVKKKYEELKMGNT